MPVDRLEEIKRRLGCWLYDSEGQCDMCWLISELETARGIITVQQNKVRFAQDEYSKVLIEAQAKADAEWNAARMIVLEYASKHVKDSATPGTEQFGRFEAAYEIAEAIRNRRRNA